MSKAKGVAANFLLGELFRFTAYKRNQGRTVRLVTSVTIFVVFALAAWRLYDTLAVGGGQSLQWFGPLALLVVGGWFSYRITNLPRFADFLIAVEAEMSKVSWPSRTELIRSSLVVIFLMFALAAILFGFDLFWQSTFKLLGVIN